MRVRVAIAVVAALVAVGGGVGPAAADDPTTTTTAATPPVASAPAKLVPRTCDTKVATPVRCYWLEVPEHRGVAGTRTLRLWVAVFTPRGTPSTALPSLSLTGGPGDAASTSFVDGRASLVGAPRPFVVVDQRGTGRSTPRPSCPQLDTTIDPRLPWSQQLTQVKARATTCASKLRAEGFDLDGYNTIENAADFVDLRKLLGFSRWDVYGLSYGGRLAPELYRQDPAAVRRMHLDSPIASSHLGPASLLARAKAAVLRADAACAKVTTCAADGSLAANLDRAYQRLEAHPFVTTVGGVKRIINGDTLLSGAFQALYRTDLIPLLPAVAKGLAGGDTSILGPLAQQLVPSVGTVDSSSRPIESLIDCADDGPATAADEAVMANPGRWSALLADPRNTCAAWGLTGVPGGHLPRPGGNVPTLLTEGQLDPIAPVTFFGGTIKREFPNITVAVVRGAGHVVAFANPCITSISVAFADGPNPHPSTGCLAGLPLVFSG